MPANREIDTTYLEKLIRGNIKKVLKGTVLESYVSEARIDIRIHRVESTVFDLVLGQKIKTIPENKAKILFNGEKWYSSTFNMSLYGK